VIRAAEPAPVQPFTYPVPPPVAQPKHLFHFIIRYEGAGIIDSNVVRFMKAQNEKAAAASDTDTSGPRGVIKSITNAASAPSLVAPEVGMTPSGSATAPGTEPDRQEAAAGDSLPAPRPSSKAKRGTKGKEEKKATDDSKP
jgi:hypothetical protein